MHRGILAVVVLSAACVATAAAQTTGKGGSIVQGSAGPGGATDAAAVERCDRPYGALAVLEPQYDMQRSLSQYGLQSPTQLLRMIVQQSNCFTVVERGMAMQTLQQERDLQQSGELRSGSGVGKGQIVAADYVLTPSVVFRESNAGAVGGGIGGIIGGSRGDIVAGVLGGLKFKEAQTAITLADVRTSVQVAAAEGSAHKADLALGALIGPAAGGGYTSTNEGKMVAASFLDNWNNIVRAIRGSPQLSTVAAEKGGLGADAGDVLWPKINGVKMFATASATARVVATLRKEDELVYLGDEQDGFFHVQGEAGEGWVQKILLMRAN